MANTIPQSGANSATFIVPPVEGSFGTVGKADWAALPAGQLKSLLNTTYGAGDPFTADFGAFFDAAAAVGMYSIALTKKNAPSTGAHTDVVSWDVDAEGHPVATVETIDPVAEYQLRIVTRYSASE